jgi:formylglycine-generating enzyme required for sulfatase activity
MRDAGVSSEVTNGDYRLFLEEVARNGDEPYRHSTQEKGKDHTPKYWHDADYNPRDRSASGVFDLAGNVREWSASPYGSGRTYALRGRAWDITCELFAVIHLRSTGATPDHRDNDIGFRCVADLPR